MAHYQVFWHLQWREGQTRTSHWYTQGHIIAWASPQLQEWVGRQHRDLVAALHNGEKVVWWAGSRPRHVKKLGEECYPPTIQYAKQLLKCIELLAQPKEN